MESRTMEKEIQQGLPVRRKGKRYCDCGGHSMHDASKNLHHHSTLLKYSIRKLKKEKLF